MDQGGRGPARQPRGHAPPDPLLSSRRARPFEPIDALFNSIVGFAPGLPPAIYPAGHLSADSRRLEADLPDALHAQRHAAERPERGRPRVRRSQGSEKGDDRRARRSTSSSRFRRAPTTSAWKRRDKLRPGLAALRDDAAHAPPRQVVPLRGRSIPTAARRSCSTCRGTTSTGRTPTAWPSPSSCRRGRRSAAGGFRQLGRQPGQSRSDGARSLGRPDVGRDDDRHVRHRPWPSRTSRSACRR